MHAAADDQLLAFVISRRCLRGFAVCCFLTFSMSSSGVPLLSTTIFDRLIFSESGICAISRHPSAVPG